MHIVASLITLASLLATSAAHGLIVSPPPRAPGAAYAVACGNTIYNNQASDQAGPIQLLMQSASSIPDRDTCNLWLCKGYQYGDNTAKVQTYTRGQTVPFQVDIRAPHTGYANVSIVDTRTNSVIGSTLKSWDVYASTSTGVKANETSFDITVPADLQGCTTAGECVIQWFWYSPPGVDQTYEGCIDFVVAGGTAITTSTTYSVSATKTRLTIATTSSAIVVPTTSKTMTILTTPSSSSSVVVVVPTTSKTLTTTKTSTASTTSATLTTLVTSTRTHITSSAAATVTKTPQTINQCLDEVNACIRTAQKTNGGPVDFSACEAQRAGCYN